MNVPRDQDDSTIAPFYGSDYAGLGKLSPVWAVGIPASADNEWGEAVGFSTNNSEHRQSSGSGEMLPCTHASNTPNESEIRRASSPGQSAIARSDWSNVIPRPS